MNRSALVALASWTAVVAAVGCSSSKKDASRPATLELPGNRFFPESLTSDAADNVYVGSLGTGMVVKFAKNSSTSTVFVPPAGRNFAGVYADDASSTLWVCSDDLSFSTTSTVESYDLTTGAPKGSYPFPVFGFCNDFTVDASGTLYVSDSLGRILRLRSTDSAIAVWSSSALLAPSSMGGFGADGIVWDGTSALYVNAFTDGRLVKIPILGNSSAGTAALVNVTPALSFPDGMRREASGSLLVVEGIGQIVRVTVTGTNATSTTVATGLNGPTSVTLASDGYFISEGQLAALLDTSVTINLPFTVQHVPSL